jgi:hypothetical protein
LNIQLESPVTTHTNLTLFFMHADMPRFTYSHSAETSPLCLPARQNRTHISYDIKTRHRHHRYMYVRIIMMKSKTSNIEYIRIFDFNPNIRRLRFHCVQSTTPSPNVSISIKHHQNEIFWKRAPDTKSLPHHSRTHRRGLCLLNLLQREHIGPQSCMNVKRTRSPSTAPDSQSINHEHIGPTPEISRKTGPFHPDGIHYWYWTFPKKTQNRAIIRNPI